MFRWNVLALITLFAASIEAQTVRGTVAVDVAIDAASVTESDADVVVVPVFSDEDPLASVFSGAPDAFGSAVSAARFSRTSDGKALSSGSHPEPGGHANTAPRSPGRGRRG